MTHPELVFKLKKNGEAIQSTMDPRKADLMHMVLGIAGEAGELVDAVKKHVIYGQPLNMDNVVEELGDLEFYLQGLRQCLDIGREEILQHNINKLTKRYGEKYSNEAAKARVDKEEDYSRLPIVEMDPESEDILNSVKIY
jgi:NTP pyrophosphatase (non-canonical NTP hydrolase)